MQRLDAPPAADRQVVSASTRLVSEVIRGWPSSVPFDAQSILRNSPELQADRSAVLELAYEEFCRRVERGESVVPEEFASCFPEVERSLLHQLRVHRYLQEHSEILAALSVEQWPVAGEVFLGFELLEEIGRGAFSRVFLAADRNLGDRSVVVKVCRRGGEEAQILGRLQHPGIVPVHSARRDHRSGLWAICMPDLGRATLFSVLDAVCVGGAPPTKARILLEAAACANAEAVAESIGRAPRLLRRGSFVDGVLLIGVQLAEALAFAHGKGICHGDIKPSNVLLTSAGRAMLLDFNLAFAYGQAELGAIGGTLPYMAPEQLQVVLGGGASGPPPDARMDLFALGVILYELLAGRLPFRPVSSGKTTSQLAAELLERRRRGAEPLQQQNPHVDRRLARVIESCLSFAPADRPQSAEELGRMLRLALSARRRLWRWMRGHRTASIGVGAAGLIFAGGLLPGTIQQSPPVPTPRISVHRSERSENAGARLVEDGLRELQAGHLQRAIVFFDRALQSDAGLVEARFWRGRARLLLGNYQSACTDLESVAARVQSGSVTACLAYCYSLDHVHERAIQLYQQSLEEGFASAAIWNNLGHSHYRRSELDQAERCLSEALRLDPNLPAVHHNMSQVLLRRATAIRGAEGLGLARQALQCIERARESGGDSGELFRDAANLYAYLSRVTASTNPSESGDFKRRALELAEQAVDRGLAARDLAAIWPLLPRTPEVEAVKERLSRAPDADRRWQTVMVLDPLADDALVTELRSELARASAR